MAHQTVERPADGAAPVRRRGAGLWAGLALVVVGAVVLGWVGWQYVGTNVVSREAQRALVERTQRAWTLRPGSTAHGGRGAARTAQALIRIPRFGRHYVMPVQRGVSEQVLAEGFGHFRGTARAGQVGNYALAAHRVTHGQPLRNLPELRPGDRVLVETRARVYTYVLDTDPNDLVVSFRDVWVIDPLPTNPTGGVQPARRPGQRLVTLTTCAELFHTDRRMIAFGHLVGSAPR